MRATRHARWAKAEFEKLRHGGMDDFVRRNDIESTDCTGMMTAMVSNEMSGGLLRKLRGSVPEGVNQKVHIEGVQRSIERQEKSTQ